MRRFFPFVVIVIILACIVSLFVIPSSAAHSYGPPASSLDPLQVVQYSAKLVWYDGLLTRPLDVRAPEQSFSVRQNESVGSIGNRLVAAGLIEDASAFHDYLVYSGLDTSIQAGDYQLSPAMSIVELARAMQDATPLDVTFVILPGWRMEEIAASLPTSGLDITPDEFLALTASHPGGYDFFDSSASSEGFLYPDTYILPRTTTSGQLLDALLRNFALHLTDDLSEGFARQGLTVYQAVTLASIVQREAVHEEEQPTIASVFFNRLNSGMKLDSDPTVQYALGYNTLQQTWWTNPLRAADLQFASPYNTYLNPNLPPGPIASPSLSALRAVAFPAQTAYYYFRAKCDGSGLHNFAETLEEHINNGCE